jgi:hypothetical protein
LRPFNFEENLPDLLPFSILINEKNQILSLGFTLEKACPGYLYWPAGICRGRLVLSAWMAVDSISAVGTDKSVVMVFRVKVMNSPLIGWG